VVSEEIHEVTIEPVDRGRYANEAQIAGVRRELRERDGFPVTQLLAEIEHGRHEARRVTLVKAKNENAILEGDGTHVRTPHPLPTAKRSKPQRKAKGEEAASDNSSAWQEGLWQKP
jgi:hypothetical protein